MDRQKMKVKICLVGEGAVGKTCLIRRFIQDQFDDRYISTLGAKVSKKEIKLDGPNGGSDIDMTIWDIMGEKGFRELLKEAYFHGAQGVLAVCDVTRKQTLEDLGEWVAAVVKVTGNVPIEFLANKADRHRGRHPSHRRGPSRSVSVHIRENRTKRRGRIREAREDDRGAFVGEGLLAGAIAERSCS